MRKFKIGEVVKYMKYRVVIVGISEKKLKVVDQNIFQLKENFELITTEVYKGSVRKTGVYFIDAENDILKSYAKDMLILLKMIVNEEINPFSEQESIELCKIIIKKATENV